MMDNILQEFYHGMIHPEEEYRPMSEEHQQAQKQLTRKTAALLERIALSDTQLRDEVEELLNQTAALEAMAMKECYIQGMRMGARLAMGLLSKNSI